MERVGITIETIAGTIEEAEIAVAELHNRAVGRCVPNAGIGDVAGIGQIRRAEVGKVDAVNRAGEANLFVILIDFAALRRNPTTCPKGQLSQRGGVG